MASANAAPPPALVIEWEAPSDCPDAEQVRGAVWAAVGSTRPSRTANVTARAVVTKGAGGFTMRLAIETDGALETKTVDADTCATLADAYAVIVAFRFDPESAGRVVPPPRMHVPPSDVEAASPAPGPSAPARRFRLGAGPVLATSIGELPFPAYAIGAAAEAEYGMRWSVSAAYGWSWQTGWAPTTAAGSPVYGATMQLLSVQPSACLPVAGGVIAFCGAVELGAMIASGTGSGVVRSKVGTAPWLSFLGGVEFELPVARFVVVRIRLDAGIPASRPTFTVDDAGAVGSVAVAYQPDSVFGLLRLEPLFPLFSTDSSEPRHIRP